MKRWMYRAVWSEVAVAEMAGVGSATAAGTNAGAGAVTTVGLANPDVPSAVSAFLAKHEAELRAHLAEQRLYACAWFAWEDQLFIYAESEGEQEPTVIPPAWVEAYFQRWPGVGGSYRACVPLMDVFHDGVPTDRATWLAGRTIEERVGSLARLEPSWYSSYIFYHYQMQEEKPSSFNKTYMIGAQENWIFSYHETPSSLESSGREGLLKTKLSPPNWHEVMGPHFIPWTEADGSKLLWRRLQLAYCYEA